MCFFYLVRWGIKLPRFLLQKILLYKQCKEVGLTSLSTGWKPGKTHPCNMEKNNKKIIDLRLNFTRKFFKNVTLSCVMCLYSIDVGLYYI